MTGESLRIDPLSIAETDALVAELRSRFERGLVITGVCETQGEKNSETFFCDYFGGLTICIGLMERSKARMLQTALTPEEDE